MRKSLIIQKSIALGLLLLFALSITPKPYLHTLFAGHIDSSHHCFASGKSDGCIHISGFTCQLDNPVIHTEYTVPLTSTLDISGAHYVQYVSSLSSPFISFTIKVNGSRGPPVAV